MKRILAATAFALVALSCTGGANANPAGALQGLKSGNGIVEQAHWWNGHRHHRRCWWRHGHRHCRWW